MRIIFFFIILNMACFAGSLRFERDDRPFDGKYYGLELDHDLNFKDCDLEFLIKYHSRIEQREVVELHLTPQQMVCDVDYSQVTRGIIEKIICSKDDRPIDGALTEITITRLKSGKYNVDQLTKYYSRMEQREIIIERILGRNLERTL